jgi:hypothetical protein
MSTSETIIITGSATVGDIQPLSDEGSKTFLLYGKKVKLLNKSNKKIKRLDIDNRRMYQKADGLPMADISRVWVNGGVTITGQATVGDTDGTVVYGDTKREWVNGGISITGQATVGDTDSTIIYGDTIRANATLAEELGYSAFIRYSDHSLVINNTTFVDGATNAVAVYDCLPNTKYIITMNMYSRFRVGSYAGVPASETVLTTYQCHTLDDNSTTSQNGSSQSMIFTTGASDTKLFIGYWTTTDTVKAAVIKPTINVDEYIAPPTMTANVALTSSGTTTSDSTHCVTDYIPISNSTSITYSVGEDVQATYMLEYRADKTNIDYWYGSPNPRTQTLTGGTKTAYIRLTCLTSNLAAAYIYDNTNKKYLFKGRYATVS